MAESGRPLHNGAMAALDIELPGGCVAEAGPIGDHPLLGEEALCIERAVVKRRRQFASGRHYARLAMHRLTGNAVPILRDGRGRPVWPAGLIGSISHSDSMVAAVVSDAPLRGIGIDVEDTSRLDPLRPRLGRRLFTAGERSVKWTDPHQSTLLFSGKEAAYKAINPLVGRYIGFQEVEVEIDPRRCRFRVRYLGEHAPNRLLDRGSGYFRILGDQVVALFVIE